MKRILLLFFCSLIACSIDTQPIDDLLESERNETVISDLKPHNTKGKDSLREHLNLMSKDKLVSNFILSNTSKYEIVKSSFDNEGVTFKVISADTSFLNLFKDNISNEFNSIFDTLGKHKQYGGTLKISQGEEAMGTMIYLDPLIPNNLEDYVNGFEWIKIDKDYYNKSLQYGLWGIQSGDMFSYRIDFSESEISFLKNNPVDSIGLSPDYKHDIYASWEESYDTLYYFKNYPNKKIPIRSNWKRKGWWFDIEIYFENIHNQFYANFLFKYENINIKNLNLDSSYEYYLNAYTESEDFYELVVGQFGEKVVFSIDEVKDLDLILGTDYYSSWYKWKTRPKKRSKDFTSDCSSEVRRMLEGAGWELVGVIENYSNGLYRAVGAKPGLTGVLNIYYQMDSNCKPVKVEFD
jgi:hypothetical protein